MIIYAQTITSRLRYIVSFIFGELHDFAGVEMTDDFAIFKKSEGVKINYSLKSPQDGEFLMLPQGLLFEQGIVQQKIKCFDTGTYKAFFKTGGDFPFDLFSAAFYILSRYEEYLPHEKDSYGRFAHTSSLAFREEFLKIPLVNIWIKDFKSAIEKKFPSLVKADITATDSKSLRKTQFSLNNFWPTYDIDEAFAYRYKSFLKHTGGFIKSLMKGNWSQIRERMKVLTGKLKDPYDAYQWMDELHKRLSIDPKYFFIVASKKSRYDKNLSPRKTEMRHLIRHHKDKYAVGIHPSWQSGDDLSLLRKEKESLENIIGEKVVSSRQHYIRFTLPDTFRQLLAAGIKFDFSIGYGSINGFRASVASPFYWYDLEKEVTTDLLLYPFCFMDANSFFEQHNSPKEAYEEMKDLYEEVRNVNGVMITIWHNNFLGRSPMYAGWREVYEKFVEAVVRG